MEERSYLVKTRRFLEDEIRAVRYELEMARDEMLVESLMEELDELNNDLYEVKFDLGEI